MSSSGAFILEVNDGGVEADVSTLLVFDLIEDIADRASLGRLA